MKLIRVAKYRRVSTKEQKLHGFSLKAQDEALDEYIKNHNYAVAGEYADEGITASRLNRPGLQALLSDVKAGKIDLIIFTKLDRWFRSVAMYHKIQEILEKNHVAWRAVLEDYNTETSDGRFKVNIMLAVAQQELDRTSERIKVVFKSKVKNKQVITGALPLGYKIGTVNNQKQVIKNDEVSDIVLDLFSHYEIHQSIRGTMTYLNDKYDINLSYKTCRNMLGNSMYTGTFQEVENYCPAYITKERFDKIQKRLEQNIRQNQTNRVYLFSNFMKCKECGRTLSGNNVTNQYGYSYYLYRCNNAVVNHQCQNGKRLSEVKIEKYLLENVEKELEKYILKSEVGHVKKPKPKYDVSKIKSEMERLNSMYLKNRISEEKYDAEYEDLEQKLKIAESEKVEIRDLKPLKEFLKSDFKSIYDTFDRKEKRSMWHAIIKQITVHDYDNIDIEFL